METKSNLRASTQALYRTAWKNNVENSTLGNMKISQIKQLHVKAFYSGLVKHGLAEKTIKLCHSMIFPALHRLLYLNFGDGCKFHVQDLKTEAGRRDIPLTTNARKRLIKQRELNLMLGRTAKQQDGGKFFPKRYKKGTK